MAALDFPNSPTTNQQYAAPNGVTYQWDGAAWVVTGGPPGQLWTGGTGTLSPTDQTKQVILSPINDALVAPLTGQTVKGHLGINPSASFAMRLNANVAGTALDDTTKPGWTAQLDNGSGDSFSIWRAPAAAGTPVFTKFLGVDNVGKLTVPGSADAVDQSGVVWGTRTQKGRLVSFSASDIVGVVLNDHTSGTVWTQDDATKPSWRMLLNGTNDQFVVVRAPGGGASTQLVVVDNGGNLTISGATGTKASGTTWANPSDRRLKDDIADFATGLAAILALVPRTFVYNGKGGSVPGLRGYGFIADEVAPVMPEMVSVTRAKLDPDDAEESDIQTLDTSTLALALVNAVKELAARVDALEPHAA